MTQSRFLKIIEPHIFWTGMGFNVVYKALRGENKHKLQTTTADSSKCRYLPVAHLWTCGAATETEHVAISYVGNCIFMCLCGFGRSVSCDAQWSHLKSLSAYFGQTFLWLETLSGKIGGREEHMKKHCFFSSKCFHSLNKFNKTHYDWQEGALPQCLLFALTFLVSSCAPFFKWEERLKTHSHTQTCAHMLSAWNKWDFYMWVYTFHKCYFVSLRVV